MWYNINSQSYQWVLCELYVRQELNFSVPQINNYNYSPLQFLPQDQF